MKLTSGKLRYLLTIAALERASELKISSRVRCIDIAVQLGICLLYTSDAADE